MSYNFQPSDIIAIASLHGTIVSILIGAITAFVGFLYSKVIDKKTQLYDKARQINDIKFGSSMGERPIATDRERFVMQKRILTLVNYSVSGMWVIMEPENHDLPTLPPIEKAYEFLNCMYSLIYNYPFASNFSTNSDGSLIRGIKTEVKFNSLDEIRRWVDTVFHLHNNIRARLSIDILEVHKLIQPRDADLSSHGISSNSIETVTEVFRGIDEAYALASDAKRTLDELDAYKTKHTVEMLTIPVILAGIAFAFGVIFPIVALSYEQTVDPFWFLVIPFVIYFILFLKLLYLISEKIFD